tara:strand:- start:229 stop:354 length:126 start_codon:yes stop_codon:yes gene_type:complete
LSFKLEGVAGLKVKLPALLVIDGVDDSVNTVCTKLAPDPVP